MAMTGGTSRLVHTGYANGNASLPIKLYVYYKSSQSISENKSTIYCGMYITSPYSGYDIGPWNEYENGSYVGTTSNKFDGSFGNFSGTHWIAENKSFVVNHDDKGKGKATIHWKLNVYSTWGGFVYPSGSFEIDLPTIPRVSEVTVSKDTAKMGSSVTIYTNRKSSSFYHTLYYRIGANGDPVVIATGVGDSHPWTVPDLADKCNNATKLTCTIICHTFTAYTNGDYIGYSTKDVTLNVPDATVPSFPNGDVIIGGGNPITTNAGSKNFSHLITYSFNGKTGNVNSDKVKSGIVWWTPYDLATAIKDSTYGNGTIICKTYNGTALVGTSSPISFKAVVPDNSTTRPSFDEEGFVLSPSGSLPSAFSGLYIQGKTGVKAEFTASSTYSDIASYKLSVDGRVYTGNPATSYTLSKDGEIEVIGTVTDARGYYTQVPTSITAIPYSIPSIDPYDGDREIICERSDQNGVYTPAGTHLHIRAKRSYSPVVADGTQKNFCNLKYRYKASGGSWSEEKILLPESDTSADLYEGIMDDVVTETDKTYLVQLIVEDTIGEKIPYDFPISTDKVTLHLGEGGHGVAVGKYSEATAESEMFESQWDAMFHADLYANHIASLGLYDGKDFDDLVHQTGYYTGTSAPSSTECSNYPVDKTGVLEVISAMKQNATTLAWWGFAYHTYRTHDGEVYMRSFYTDSGFTDWKKIQFST